jgi:hypothetical protein
MGNVSIMDFVRKFLPKRDPPTKEEEANNKEYSKFRSTVPCQKVFFVVRFTFYFVE